MPELANDLRGGEVAIEALLAGSAKGAVERAARLRRDAQGAPVILRYIDCVHRIAIADIEQPLARAVAGDRVAHDDRRTNLCIMDQHLARSLGEVGHLLDSAREMVMDPAQRLLRPKRLLAALGEEGAHRCLVEVEKVDHIGKSFLSVIGYKYSAPERSTRSRTAPCPARRSRARHWLRYFSRNRRGWSQAAPALGRWRPSARDSSKSRCRLRAPGSSPGPRS